MSLAYGTPQIEKVLYSERLKELVDIKIDIKRNQRKYNEDLRLFTAELLFLIYYIEPVKNKNNRVIYMGAAPGFHLVKIMKMFPDIMFDLYDKENLHIELQKYVNDNPDQVTYFDENFSVETCKFYEETEDNLYFMTDHRDPEFMTDPIFTYSKDKNDEKQKYQVKKEESYKHDMDLQMEICKVLKPLYAYLRFRPPHFYSGLSPKNASMEYFSGTLFLMVFNDYKSIEGRLVVSNFDNCDFLWNYESYQYRLNYFNNEVRESMLKNPFTFDQTPLKDQLGNKFETVMLIYLLKEYFKLQGQLTIKSSSIINFYKNFIILESCNELNGMYDVCETKTDDVIETITETAYYDSEVDENDDDEDDMY